MEIIGRNPTPDNYSIKDISLTCESWGGNSASLYLYVSLEPAYYARNRYGNDSFEKKENPCELKIRLSEFREMEDVLRRELEDCYRFLGERGLLGELRTHKYPPKEETKRTG